MTPVENAVLSVLFKPSLNRLIRLSKVAYNNVSDGVVEIEAGVGRSFEPLVSDDPPDPDADSRSGAALAVLGLVFVVALAYVAKRRFLDGGDETPLDEEFDEDFDVAA